ncbi:ferredoxin reductase family protein [Actinokineospora terrae]|uniref:Ferredoxin-NADP reductase n=1 Tax=Actinokineospora terrae TaxID=155974 RepID=A0A1H9T321_9PSEU|nr:ferredoxin reductase family protein [Actinokineospora terrae]SER91516.1 Ferredoxin-NADP reductase [Actinokineospora terrae]
MRTTAGRTTGSATGTPSFTGARVDRAVRLATGSALWLGLLLVTYWWVAGGGITGLTSWTAGLLSVGRLAGLLGSALLLAQVLAMARIPVVERAFGQDAVIRHHRILGFTSLNLVLAHIVVITWGYAAGELTAVPTAFWDLVTDYPGVLLALAGTVCLVLTAVSSVRAARRRLRYESWHLLHLYAYLGVGLALPHQLWTGQEFLTSTAATVFWWALWIAAVGAVLIWRVGLPVVRNLRHDLRVTTVVPEADGVFSVYLTGRDLHRLPARAGQFLGWRFPGRPGWTRANPYSLSAAPDGRSLRITVKALGDGSAALAGLAPGTRALFEGPYGRLTQRARTSDRVLLVGAGVGITPLRALAEEMTGDVAVLHRFTSQPLFAREFAVLAAERRLRVVDLPGHRRGGDSWLGDGIAPVDDVSALRALVPDIAAREVYVCGPEQWTALVRATALAAGVPAERLHIENFAW